MAKPKMPQGRRGKRTGRTSAAQVGTLVERIAEELRERIIDGTLAPGEHLQQAALARRMGVSSIPFREAIRALELQGFVELVPFKGARVKGLTFEEISERAEIACALECLAIELALPDLGARDLDRADELAGRLYPAPDVKTWFERVNALLHLICGAERRPHVFRLILRNRTAARRYTELLVRKTLEDKAWERDWASGHFRRLVELMRAGDIEGIRALERFRFDGYVEQLSPWLETEAPPAAEPRGPRAKKPEARARVKARRSRSKRTFVSLRAERGGGASSPKTGKKATKRR